MNLETFLKQQRGLASELARTLGVSAAVVSTWASGARPIPPERCPSIERATAGAVTCEELRPDVDWAVLRGQPARQQQSVMIEGAAADPHERRIVPVESA